MTEMAEMTEMLKMTKVVGNQQQLIIRKFWKI